MHERMLWIEVKTIETERRMPVGIKHKMVEHDSTIHIERALDGIGTFGMATFPALARQTINLLFLFIENYI